MNWDTMNLDLGTLSVGKRIEITFTYIGPNPELITQSNVRASCGCSTPIWNPSTKQLKVLYLPNPVPVHLTMKGQNQYNSSKYITVNYAGREERLTFTALIRKS